MGAVRATSAGGVAEDVCLRSGWSDAPKEAHNGQIRRPAGVGPTLGRQTPRDNMTIGETAFAGKGSDVIIILLVANNNTCEYRDAMQHDGLRRLTIDGQSIVTRIVQVIRGSAPDGLEPPSAELLARVARALELPGNAKQPALREHDAATHFANLTPRQREVMELILAGRPNKIIAADLGISQRTVENHRASIMKKTGVKSLPALVRLAMAAGEIGNAVPTSRH
jgi:DNA-binding NarL/FixJ family response regulator